MKLIKVLFSFLIFIISAEILSYISLNYLDFPEVIYPLGYEKVLHKVPKKHSLETDWDWLPKNKHSRISKARDEAVISSFDGISEHLDGDYWVYKKDTIARHRVERSDGQVVFDVNYTLNEKGLRHVPIPSNKIDSDLPGLTGSTFCVNVGPITGGQNGKKTLYPRRNYSTFTDS